MSRVLSIILMLFIVSTGSFALDPSQRPDELKGTIQRSFKELSVTSGKNWRYQGEGSSYGIMHIDPAELAHMLIKTAPKDQKDFYLLDIGAGVFGWSKGTANYLNQQTDIPDDVTIHIIGVTGENYGAPTIKQVGRCKIYNISAFNIEDIKQSFEDLGFDFNGKIDLVVSEFTFIHLHDAVGTFIQVYNLLRPDTGYILMHGIPVFFVGQKDNEELVWNLIDFLIMTKAPFLIGPGTGERWIESFLLRKPNNAPLSIPLTYGYGTFPDRLVHTKHKSYANFVIGEAYKRSFDKNRIAYGRFDGSWGSPHEYYGNKDLYEWVYMHYKPWQRMDTKWLPMMTDDQNAPIEHKNEVRYIPQPKEISKPDPLFKIARSGTLEEFKAAVNQDNVNKKNPDGEPLIMLFQKHDLEKTLWLLLESGLNVDINAEDEDKRTVLFGWHNNPKAFEARQQFLNAYLEKGIDINHQDIDGNTPLHDAIKLKSPDVVSWLLKNGADPTINNKQERTAFELPQAERDPEIKKVIEDYKKHKHENEQMIAP